MKTIYKIICLQLALLFIAGCTSVPTSSINNNALSRINRVAVLPFTDAPGADAGWSGHSISGMVQTEAMKRKDWTVIERSQIDKILQEQKLQSSQNIDQTTAVRVGRLLGANGIILGSVSQYQIGSIPFFFLLVVDKNTYRVGCNFRLINVETGELCWSTSATSDSWISLEKSAYDAISKAFTELNKQYPVTENTPKIVQEEQVAVPKAAIISDNKTVDKLPLTTSKHYYALIIGNDSYTKMASLKSASNDAKAIDELLSKQYNFQTTLLLNAKAEDIIKKLGYYRTHLTQDDCFLIYYAGHGWLDQEADQGYWLPVDAEKDNEVNWISNTYVISTVKAIRAKHVLVIADSCFAGKLTRGLNVTPESSVQIDRIADKKSRTVMTSGGLEPVIDTGGKDKHSVFASAFIDVLKENKDAVDASSLFVNIRRKVVVNSDQTPEYSDIHKAGHDGGDFIFVRKTAAAK